LSANSAVQISLPAVVRELPAYPPVVCVTPDWKPEPCKSRSASTVVAKSTAPSMTNSCQKELRLTAKTTTSSGQLRSFNPIRPAGWQFMASERLNEKEGRKL